MKTLQKSWLSYSLLSYVNFALILILVAFSGCTSIKLIADYDEQTDKSITAFQKKIEMHLTKLERNIGKDEAKYENHLDFYDEAKVDLSAVRVRAAALPKNAITLQQINLLIDSLNKLEKIHKKGIAQNDIVLSREVFNTSTTAILKLELAKKRSKKIEK